MAAKASGDLDKVCSHGPVGGVWPPFESHQHHLVPWTMRYHTGTNSPPKPSQFAFR